MKRKLLKQIATEWRSNLWLGIELLIISCILFFIFDTTAAHFRLSNTFIGVDATNVYRLSIGWKNQSSPTFEATKPLDGETGKEASSRANRESYEFKLQQLRNIPGVISVAPASSAPYNYNYHGNRINFTGNSPESLKNEEIRTNNFYVNPDYPKVFNIRGVNGETPEQLSKMLEDGKVLVTSNIVDPDKTGIKLNDLINLPVYFGSEDDGRTSLIGALIEPIRRADYEPAIGATVLQPSNDMFTHVYVRIKDGYDDRFQEAVTAPNPAMDKGNSYIIEAKSFKNIRNDLHRNDDAQLRNLNICMGFLLLTVFLGLLVPMFAFAMRN